MLIGVIGPVRTHVLTRVLIVRFVRILRLFLVGVALSATARGTYRGR